MSERLRRVALRVVPGTVSIVALAGWMVLRQRPMVSDAEMAELYAWRDARVAEVRAETCRRAVLIAPATEGSGTEALEAVVTPDAFVDCFDALEESRHRLYPNDTDRRAADPFAVIEPVMPEACASLPSRIDAAIAHDRVCSPWRAGVGELPSGTRLDDLVDVLAIEARSRSADGAASEGIRVLLGGARFFEDLARGTTGAVVAMVSMVYEDRLLRLVPVLAVELEAAERSALIRELDTLLDTSPDPRRILIGEPLAILHYDESADDGSDEMRAFTLGVREAARRLTSSCPESGSVTDCMRAVDGLAAARTRPEEPGMASVLLGPRAHREDSIDDAASMQVEQVSRFLQGVAWTRVVLRVTRFALENAGSECSTWPTEVDVEGRAMTIEQDEGGAWVRPTWTSRTSSQEPIWVPCR